MNRTRYRLPAIAVMWVLTSVAVMKWEPDLVWCVALVGAGLCVAEIGRHYGDFRRIARVWIAGK
jgi:hypothetical protein